MVAGKMGSEVLYFVKIVGYHAFPLPTQTGGRWPAYASALGKALMACGTSDPLQCPPASGLVSGPPVRLRPAQRAPLLRRTAAKITHHVGGRLPDGWR